MAGGLSLITQDSFVGGMYQAPDVQKIPANGVYDVQNGLFDADEGDIYRRGGSTYKASAAPATLVGAWDAQLAAGQRTVLQTATNLYQLAADDTTVTNWLAQSSGIARRPAIIGGIMGIPYVSGANGSVILFAGSRGTIASITGTVTAGSQIVTGSGTTWLTDPSAVPGAMLNTGAVAVDAIAAIRSVDSNTQITLATPWPGTTQTGSIASNSFMGVNFLVTRLPFVASVANRLIVGADSIIKFSHINNPAVFDILDFHTVPDGGVVTGLQGVRGTLLVFSTAGVFSIRNLAYDLTDPAGNPQQQLEQITGDVLLWSDAGVAMWRGAAVVPAVDDCYLMDGTSTPVSIGGPIRTLWRTYVAAGYGLGTATVHRGHYILPVLNGTTWVDTLVCQLATGAWSRMAGFSGSCVGFTQRVPTGESRVSSLYGVRGTRLVNCSGWWTPTAANKNEADGTTHTFSLTTRDYALSSLRALCKKIRLWTEGVDAGTDSPTLTASYATGIAGSSFTSLTGTAGASTGDAPAGVWSANAGGKHVRFQFASTSPWASLKIKALDLFVRPRGRQ